MPSTKTTCPTSFRVPAALGLACLSLLGLTSAPLLAQTPPATTVPVQPVPPPAPAVAPVPKEAAPAPPVPTVTTPDRAAPLPAMPVGASGTEASLPDAAVTQVMAPPPTQTLTLDQCLETAFANRDATLRYGLSQDRAERNVALAKTAFLPQFTSNARVTPFTTNNLVSNSPDGVSFSDERGRLGLTASLPLYDAGLRKDRLKIAQSGLRQTQDAIQTDKSVLVQSTLVAFFRVLRSQRLVEAAGLQTDAARRQLDAAQTRLKLGAVTRSDVLSAQSQLASALARQDGRNLTLIASRASLARILGGDPTQLVPAVTAPEPSAQPIDAPDVLITRALQNSPQRDRLVAAREAARTGLSVIRADQSPRVTLKVSGGIVERKKDGHDGLTSDPYSQFALNLSLPLLSKPSVRAREQSQEDAIQLRDLAIRQFDRRLKEQILVASAAYMTSAAQVSARQAAEAAAEEASRLAQERYAVGRGTQTDVFDALLRLSNSRDQLANTLNQRDIASQQLRLSVGSDLSLLDLIPTGEGDDGLDSLLTTPLPDAGATGGDLLAPDAGGVGTTAGVGPGGTLSAPDSSSSSDNGFRNEGF